MDKYEDGFSIKSNPITHFTNQKIIPQSRSNIYKLLTQYKDGSINLDDPWKKKGAPKLLKDNDIAEIGKDLETYNGKSIGYDDILDVMVQKKRWR